MLEDFSKIELDTIDADSDRAAPAAEMALAPALARDGYGAIVGRIGTVPVSEVQARFAAALPACYADFDRARRGDAVNHALYGYDGDRGLAVFQVRHFYRRSRHGYANVRKAYFLVGFTETGAASPAEVVRVADRWIFRITPGQHARSVRQGDVLMFPARGRPAPAAEPIGRRLLLLDSHELRAHEIVRGTDGEVWAYDPAIYHLKDQHIALYAPDVDGWWIVRPGREGTSYDFAERLGD